MSVFQDVVMVLDGKISEVDEKEPEASEEMRKLRVERGQAGSGSAEGVSDTAGVRVDREAVL